MIYRRTSTYWLVLCVGYMVAEGSISRRLGGLYCLYCLFETQPFKPPFKIYLSLGELKRLKNLTVDAKQQDIGVVCRLVKHMLQRNMFLFGSVDSIDGSTEKLNELTAVQNARVQVAYKKLFANTQIEDFIHMDLGIELDVDLLKRKSSSYAAAKELAIREAGEVIDVGNIKLATENTQLIGDVVEKTAGDWNAEKELFYKQTGINQPSSEQEGNRPSKQQKRNGNSIDDGDLMRQEGYENINEQDGNECNEDFDMELEEALLSLPLENEDEEPRDMN
ncbi:OLC1v1038034C3 [Oldenlandia corymbosa var. corymbosa]|uniref:OLC1v1038034C3 n=1 Tax=Oldenlandia corymbosa var. corymbosa TaxID=529605 RepID=A0AAV1CYU8_OLDCO|nr:OLC1v1038034C3 [Oldenlandia corymbosa var. corymbosa]